MNRHCLWIAVAAIVLGPALVQAQDNPRPIGVFGPVAGDVEVTLNGSGSNDGDFDNGGFSLGGSIGWFVTDEVLIALRQSLTYTDTEAGGSDFNGATRIAADYHFDLERLQPFVGLSIGGVYGDTVDDDSFSMGFEGGVKYFVHERTFLFGMAEYQWLFDNSFDDGQFLYTLGVGFLF